MTLDQTTGTRAGFDAAAGDDGTPSLAVSSLGVCANLAGGAPAAPGRSFPPGGKSARVRNFSNAPWTAAEDARLVELCAAGEVMSAIAAAIGRSRDACRGRAIKRGLSFAHDGNGPARIWDRDAVLDLWVAEVMSAVEIEQHFGMPAGVVSEIVRRARAKFDPRATSRKRGRRPDAPDAGQAPAVWVLRAAGKEAPDICAELGLSMWAVRKALRSDPAYVRGVPTPRKLKTMQAASTVRIDRIRAKRADMAARLPALLAKHGGFSAVARAIGRRRQWLCCVAREFRISAPPRPVVPKVPKPRKPRARRAARHMPISEAVRLGGMPRAARPVLVNLPDCDDPRVNRGRAILLADLEADAFEVRKKTGLELRQVYQIRAEIREARRAA